MPAQVESSPGDGASACSVVPSLVGQFVDSFVDYVVGGQVLGPAVEAGVTNCVGAEAGSAQDGGAGAGVELLQYPAAERVVAIGDVHGDLEKAGSALRLAGVLGEDNEWVGGRSVVVQVGDVLDRGSQELRIIYLLEKLKRQARRAGGDVLVINGNHEVMNMEGNFTYASAGALDEFQHWALWYRGGEAMKSLCEGLPASKDAFQGVPEELPEGARARMAALRPGGPVSARFFAEHPTVVMVGGTVFVHGGVLPGHAVYGLGRINQDVRQWMLGKTSWYGPNELHGRNAVVWARHFSHEEHHKCDCDMLQASLGLIPGATRMVVGHTIQEQGINFACDERVYRVDVGMSEGCGDRLPQVLEILRDSNLQVRSLVPGLRSSAKWNNAWHKERAGLASLVT